MWKTCGVEQYNQYRYNNVQVNEKCGELKREIIGIAEKAGKQDWTL